MNNAKIKEITVSLSGTIAVAAYENLRPGFSMTVEPIDQEPEKIIVECQELLRSFMEKEENRAKSDLIDKAYSSLRFYPRNGRKYPSVTSVLEWDVDMAKKCRMTPDELKQYASRGNIVEALMQHYLIKGVWERPETIPALKEDVIIVAGGSLGLSWDKCSHKKFIEQFGDKIKAEKFQGQVFNDELVYAGTYDILGEYDGIRSIIDIKCRAGGWDMRQLAAYAMCFKDIEQLVVFPVGQTDNKCGYKKPVFCNTIQKEYEDFLKARAKFKRRFGI